MLEETMKIGPYHVYETLGEGSFGRVKRAVHKDTGLEVAIKFLDLARVTKEGLTVQVRREISLLKRMDHPGIIKLYEVLKSPSQIFLVTEIAHGGDLFDRLSEIGRFSEAAARPIFAQIIDAFAYAHSMGVAVRDCKNENIMLSKDNVVKITDFGFANLASDENGMDLLLETTCGTANYISPEVLSTKKYDGRVSDIWAIGCVLFVMIAGYLPFDQPSQVALFTAIRTAKYTPPAWFSPELVDLVKRILCTDPSKRISLKGIQEHPWSKGIKLPLEQVDTSKSKDVKEQKEDTSKSKDAKGSPGNDAAESNEDTKDL